MIIEAVIIECPHCNLRSSHHIAISGTVFESIVYTDGKMDVLSGMYSENPSLIKCRKCSAYFFFDENQLAGYESKEAYNENVSELTYNEYLLSADDFRNALLEMKHLRLEKEILLRTKFWWSVNDFIREDINWQEKKRFFTRAMNYLLMPLLKLKRFHPKYSVYKRYLMDKNENLIKLLGLLKPQNHPEEWLTVVEIYRELSQFTKADEALKKAPKGQNQKYFRLQKKLISKKDLYVRRVQ